MFLEKFSYNEYFKLQIFSNGMEHCGCLKRNFKQILNTLRMYYKRNLTSSAIIFVNNDQ